MLTLKDGPGSSHEEPVSEKVRALEQRQEKVLQELHKLQERVQLLAQKQWLNLPVSAPEQPLQKQGMVATSLHKELESPVQVSIYLPICISEHMFTSKFPYHFPCKKQKIN